LRVNHFFVCTNERPKGNVLPSCAPAGGRLVYDEFVREIAQRGLPEGLKVTWTACLTPCQVGPNVVVYPDGVWYAHVVPGDVREIIEAHLNGRVVERLVKPDDARVW